MQTDTGTRREERASDTPIEINIIKVVTVISGAFAIVWALLTFAVDSLPGEWVTGAAFVIFGTLALIAGLQINAGVRNLSVINLIALGMAFVLIAGALSEQEWITPLFLIVPIITAALGNIGNGKAWFYDRR
jgi:energy-converting hydrogenase Eha subunit E